MLEELVLAMRQAADKEQSEKMSAYMKNMFPFLGIPRPALKALMKPYMKGISKQPIDWEGLNELWEMDFREAQYVALECLEKQKKKLVPADLDRLRHLIVTKSWWETVDQLDGYVGQLVQQDPSLKETMLAWATNGNMWLRRVAIDHQQRFGEKTDTELLSKVIEENLDSKEFFINKAIGWSLREYGKVHPQWVRDFVNVHKEKMAPLSIKEALKQI